MEHKRKESTKTQNSLENTAFSNQMMIPAESSFSISMLSTNTDTSLFDISCAEFLADHHKSSCGFIDMLSVQDFNFPSSTFDDFLQNITSHLIPLEPPQQQLSSHPLPSPPSTLPEYSEVVNTPATPNSSSISSSSTEAAPNDDFKKNKTTVEEEEEEEGEEEDNQEKTKKQ